jgi:hypothetical protein
LRSSQAPIAIGETWGFTARAFPDGASKLKIPPTASLTALTGCTAKISGVRQQRDPKQATAESGAVLRISRDAEKIGGGGASDKAGAEKLAPACHRRFFLP